VLLVSASTSSQSELKGLKLAAADCLGQNIGIILRNIGRR